MPKEYEEIRDSPPAQRRNMGVTNLQVLSGVLYVSEQGYEWRGLPRWFGNWHTI